MKIYVLKIGIIEEAFNNRPDALIYADTFAAEMLNAEKGVEWSPSGAQGRSKSKRSGTVTKYQLTEMIVK